MRPATTKSTPWILAILILAAASSAFAERPRYVEERAYVGGFGLFTTLSDDAETGFSGLWVGNLMGTPEFDLVPKIKMNYGFGGLVGYRRGDYALEVSYWRSAHKAELGDASLWPVVYKDWAIYQSFNVDLKRYILTYLPAQPYFSMGLGFPWLIVHNGSTIGSGYYTDSSFSGMGFNLGVGLEFFALPNVTVTGGLVKRWISFENVKGAYGEVGEIRNPSGSVGGIKDDSLSFFAGATVDFF